MHEGEELPQDFKMTELGLLPEEWEVAKLEEVASVKGGKRLPKGNTFAEEPTPYPYIRVVDFKNGSIDTRNLKYLKAQDYAQIKRYIISSQDVYISIAGTTGLVGTVPPELDGANLTENAAKLVLKRERQVDQRFLSYFLSSKSGQTQIIQRTTKTSQPKLALVRIQQIAIPLPPFSEQRAIAHVLRTVQRSKEVTEKVIAATRQLKQSLMQHLFTYGPVPFNQANRMKLKETEIGQVPEHWKVVPLKELLREPLRNGHSAKATHSDDGIRTLILTAITQNNFSIKNTKLTSADPQRVRDMWLKRGDILIERANTPEYVGLAALYEGEDNFAIFPDLLVRVRVNEKRVVPKFLAEFLLTPACRKYYQTHAKATAGNFPKIDQGIIEDTLILLPPLPEQHQSAGQFAAVNTKLAVEETRRDALDALFQSLLHHLMTGKMRVHDLDLPAIKRAAP